MPPKAIIFDRDNTLLRLDPAGIAQFEARVHTIAPELPARAAVQHWLGWSAGWPRTAAAEEHFWQQFWSTLVTRHQLHPEQARQLQELGAFYHTVFVAFPDTLPCLTRLHEHHIPMAILTNFDLPSIDRTLLHAGIDPSWFQALCSSAELGLRKPHPAAYHAVAKRLNLPVADCLFIDDLIENVESACQLGMHGILIDRADRHSDYAGKRVQNLDTISTFI